LLMFAAVALLLWVGKRREQKGEPRAHAPGSPQRPATPARPANGPAPRTARCSRPAPVTRAAP
jgi:hypothetical protein